MWERTTATTCSLLIGGVSAVDATNKNATVNTGIISIVRIHRSSPRHQNRGLTIEGTRRLRRISTTPRAASTPGRHPLRAGHGHGATTLTFIHTWLCMVAEVVKRSIPFTLSYNLKIDATITFRTIDVVSVAIDLRNKVRLGAAVDTLGSRAASPLAPHLGDLISAEARLGTHVPGTGAEVPLLPSCLREDSLRHCGEEGSLSNTLEIRPGQRRNRRRADDHLHEASHCISDLSGFWGRNEREGAPPSRSLPPLTGTIRVTSRRVHAHSAYRGHARPRSRWIRRRTATSHPPSTG